MAVTDSSAFLRIRRRRPANHHRIGLHLERCLNFYGYLIGKIGLRFEEPFRDVGADHIQGQVVEGVSVAFDAVERICEPGCKIRNSVEGGPVAQRLEQRTHNPLVPGSNPGGPTKVSFSRGQTGAKRAKVRGMTHR